MSARNINVERHNLKKIAEILSLYATELSKIQNPSETIRKEHLTAIRIRDIIYEQYFSDEDFGMATVYLDEEYWRIILGLALKYLNDKRRVLAIQKATEKIIGSTDEESAELDRLEGLLNGPAFVAITPKEALLKSFMSAIPADSEIAEKTSIQVQVGDIYGQMIVANNTHGNISQTAVDPELAELLQALTKEVMDNPVLSPEQKNDAVGDIQAIQAQVTKTKPSKQVIQGLAISLSFLADASQVATAAVTFSPLLDKLHNLIGAIHF